MKILIFIALIMFCSSSCDEEPTYNPIDIPSEYIYTYAVDRIISHDSTAWCQGLVYHENHFYEGTGLHYASTLRKLDPDNGTIIKKISMDDQFFGEGITIFNNKIYQLTWQSHIVFVYDLDSFEKITEFYNPFEGWGLTHDGSKLILSDGTSNIYFFDPDSFTYLNKIQVTLDGHELSQLNELEFIDGKIYANIWLTNYVAIIDPETGEVTGLIVFDGILNFGHINNFENVLNGIAFDDINSKIFITGKFYSDIYEVSIYPLVP